MKILNYKIYEKAAKLIDSRKDFSYHYHCCGALYYAGGRNSHTFHFQKLFNPYDPLYICFWFGYTHISENILPRQLALLLMAEIVKNGDYL